MRLNRRRKAVLKKLALCLSTMAALASSACTIDVQGYGAGQQATVREQKTIQLTGMPTVTVRVFNGSVQLRSWDRNEILVDIERRAATVDDAKRIVVETSEDSGNVRIEAKSPRLSDDWIRIGRSSPSVRMTINVPRQLRVDVRTGDGAIDAHDLSGSVQLRSGDGPIRLQRVDGDISVTTGDGSVTARELGGTVVVATGDGSVEMSGRFEGLRARTGDGPISIDALPGSIMRSEWRVTTGDGGVMMRLPKDFDADVEAHTGDGGITTTGVEVLMPQNREDGDRRNVRGRVGKGGEMLTVRTGDGSINLVAR
jgi:DUF4097 and DUF4098 domain-containing protein YvlB